MYDMSFEVVRWFQIAQKPLRYAEKYLKDKYTIQYTPSVNQPHKMDLNQKSITPEYTSKVFHILIKLWHKICLKNNKIGCHVAILLTRS